MFDENTDALPDSRVRLHDYVARQFSMPQGRWGKITGAAMGLINWLPNRHAIDLLDIQEKNDVLEIGFGPGHALKKLCRLAAEGTVFGIDRSPTMLGQAAAGNREALAGGRLVLSHGSCESLPYDSASMDRILAVNVIYFIAPLGTALAEARRVLRPGGTMSIYATDRSTMRPLQFVGPETCHTFNAQELEATLRRSAFASDEIEIHRVWLPAGFRGLVARLRRI